MKILHVHTAMGSGGIETMLSSLANEMVKDNNVDILLIFKPKEEQLAFNTLDSRINVYTLGKSSQGFSIKYIFKLASFVRQHNYDIVNLHGVFYYNCLSVLLNHNHTKFFYTVHSDAKMENSAWDNKLLPFKRFCFKHQWMRPITISPTSQRSFAKLYGCNSYMIPNGVREPAVNKDKEHTIIETYRYTPDTRILVHAGRISTPKNQVVMCKAVNSLINAGNDLVLLIAGDNRDETIYSELCKYFDNKRIIYLGERNDVIDMLSDADAMLLPSIWEGMPMILLESLSVGCIPLCTPVGGITDVIKDEYNGLLASDASEDSVCNLLSKYMNLTQPSISEMKQNCKKTFRDYDIKLTAQTYLKTYRKHVSVTHPE